MKLLTTLLAGFVFCTICMSTSAATYTIEIEPRVSGKNVPVQAGLSVGEKITVDQAKALEKTGLVLQPGNIPAQAVTSGFGDNVHFVTVYWIDPALEKGKTKKYQVVQAKKTDRPAFVFKDVKDKLGEHRDLYHGDQPVLRHAFLKYNPDDHFNTYKHFHHLYGFHGEGLITNGPGAIEDHKKARYPHHRGLYIGWSKTKTKAGQYDWWHCRNVSIRHRSHDKNHGYNFAGPVVAQSISYADWCDPEGKPIIKEKRRVTVWRIADGMLALDFGFGLDSGYKGGDVEFNGDPQHAGFQFRPHNDVTKSHSQYIRQASASGGKGDVWKDCRWIANQFTVKDNKYVVVHMDHSSNPGTIDGRTVYSTRNYGRFGAYAPHTIKDGSSLLLSYRVLVIDPKKHTDLSVKHLESLYQQWLHQPRTSMSPG